MANECLVTKLKGTVSNPNLPKFGAVHMENVYEEQFVGKVISLTPVSGKSLTIEVDGDGYMYTLVDPTHRQSMTISANAGIYFSNGNYNIWISSKYDIKEFTLSYQQGAYNNYNTNIKFDLNEFKYSPLTRFISYQNREVYGDVNALSGKDIDIIGLSRCTNVYGDIGQFNFYNNILGLYLDGTSVTGIINGIKNKSNLASLNISNTSISFDIADVEGTNISVAQFANCNVYGDINIFATLNDISRVQFTKVGTITGSITTFNKFTNLTQLTISEQSDWSGFSGSVEEFVSAQVSNGRSTVTEASPITCPWLMYWATFGGIKRQLTGYMWLTWESASKIAILQGGTGTIANAAKVFCKGYTQQEAEAKWPGKEITLVDA